jgi:aldehyde dehydrogenase (NAD+)
METASKLLINGALIDGERTLDVLDPASGEVFKTVACASEAQAEWAVQAAKTAQAAWGVTDWEHRGSLLTSYADAIAERASEFIEVMIREQGKPWRQAADEVHGAVNFIRYFSALPESSEVLEDDQNVRVVLHHKPLGVVVGITPWNFPLLIPAAKLAPALLTGNTVVLKPAPTTPLSTLLLGEVAANIFPPGVLNVIADQNDLGSFLTSHPDVAKVTFTGSTATGRKIMESGAQSLKRLTLELGGNDAAIILGDVYVGDVAKKVFDAAFFNTGQACLAIKRAYVAAEIYDSFCDALATYARTAVVGNGHDRATEIGPLQNRQQFEKARRYLDVAHTDGSVIAGGSTKDWPGFFVSPTIVRDIEDGSALVDEEQFSPILPVIRVKDGEDALRRANNSDFGLGGSVWSSDADVARKYAARMQAGTVWINQHLNFGPNVPLAGAKQSGVGVEWGRLGLAEFCQVSIVNEAHAA